jgi:hypothetical protein
VRVRGVDVFLNLSALNPKPQPLNPEPKTLQLFLCGFGASMVFGTVAGTLVDTMGRKEKKKGCFALCRIHARGRSLLTFVRTSGKKGCLAFSLMYMLTALSTRSNSLRVLVLGRILGGTATSLLFSAPEAWMVGEHSRLSLSGEVFLFLFLFLSLFFLVCEQSRLCLSGAELAGIFSWALNCTE